MGKLIVVGYEKFRPVDVEDALYVAMVLYHPEKASYSVSVECLESGRAEYAKEFLESKLNDVPPPSRSEEYRLVKLRLLIERDFEGKDYSYPKWREWSRTQKKYFIWWAAQRVAADSFFRLWGP